MKNATQADIDKFYADTENDVNIYPFIGIRKFLPKWEEQKDNNSKMILTNSANQYLLNITFSWFGQIEFEVALFSKNTIGAGRGILAMNEQIKRYKPIAINSSVQKSNIKSLKITRKLFGKEWGVEPLAAWNMIDGCYEDLYHFRKIL